MLSYTFCRRKRDALKSARRNVERESLHVCVDMRFNEGDLWVKYGRMALNGAFEIEPNLQSNIPKD